MKRLSLIVLATAALALGACGGGGDNSSNNASTTTATTGSTGATGNTTTGKTTTSTTTGDKSGSPKKGKSGSGKQKSGSSGGSTTTKTQTTQTTTTQVPYQIPKPYNTARKVCGAFLPPQVLKPVESGKRSASSLARQYSRGWPENQRKQAYAGCLQGLKDRQPKEVGEVAVGPSKRPSSQPRVGVLVWRFGHRPRGRDPEVRRQSGWQPANLRRHDFAPATLIDVGVATGTPDLYEAFPDSYLVLIEPVHEFEPDLRRIVAGGRGEYLLTAVGAEDRSATIRVDRERPLASGNMKRPAHALPSATEEDRTVPLASLDTLLEERRWQPPFGLKIDTEGCEYEVVQGAAELLRQTQFVIAEVSVAERFEGERDFASFVALMASHGFRLADVLDGQKNALGADVVFLDLLFRPRR